MAQRAVRACKKCGTLTTLTPHCVRCVQLAAYAAMGKRLNAVMDRLIKIEKDASEEPDSPQAGAIIAAAELGEIEAAMRWSQGWRQCFPVDHPAMRNPAAATAFESTLEVAKETQQYIDAIPEFRKIIMRGRMRLAESPADPAET